MNRHLLIIAAAAFLALACGRSETTASKSAAAYRDAVAKGTPISGEGHDHHATAETTSADHSGHDAAAAGAHTGMQHDAADHAAMDPSTTSHDTAAHQGMNHAAMEHAAAGHASMDHGTMEHANKAHSATQHEGMDHSTMQHAAAAHTASGAMQHGAAGHEAMDHTAMQHGSMQPGATPPGSAHAGHAMAAAPAIKLPLGAPSTNAEMAKTNPSRTLEPDPLDAPAPSALSEAGKASGGSHASHGEGAQSQLYSCPMHPEVTSDKPGTCPKCGMTLVRKDS